MTDGVTERRAPISFKALVYIGFAAVVIGIGLGRFSFVALIPVLVQGGWADGDLAGFLAASNLLGYLAGTLVASRLGKRFGQAAPLIIAMIACSASFFFSAWNGGEMWLAFWRFVAGVSGGVLMVLAAPAVFKATPSHLKGRVAGLIFAGIGVGVAVSGVVVPWAANYGVRESWLALGILCTAATLPCLLLINDLADSTAPTTGHSTSSASSMWSKAIIALMAAYALDAIGFIPHTIYWADYLVRTLGYSNNAGGWSWSIFGCGAIVGPMLAGLAADRFGFRRSLVGAFLIKTLAVLIPLINQDMIMLSISVFLVGALTPGIVALVSGTAAALVGSDQHARAWGYITFTFAVFQALGGYMIAGLYRMTGNHTSLFAAGAAALFLGSVATFVILRLNPPQD
ncbi:MFS transporter [Aestuariispira ectoiniformans]|uniref:MFS transporter n=1 Tax=Aestuariispira ectoiniformans TaxID=2775080 RepID=UPI00223B12DE|nr:MFS transporter [Aestuariispira ectoiniformans]